MPFKEADYASFCDQVKNRIRQARVRASLAANRELVALYWEVGRMIVARQESAGWGTSVIERLSRDIRHEFPDLQGFSERNVQRMRAFYLAYTHGIANLPQPVADFDGTNLPQLAADKRICPVLVKRVPSKNRWFAMRKKWAGLRCRRKKH